MTRVYPNAGLSVATSNLNVKNTSSEANASILTVWKKSLLFNCNGFTVFDSRGDLLFRVDNYTERNKGEMVLMDAAGKPLLTIRRKKLSLGDCWLVYDGETTSNPRCSVRKNVSILNAKCLAYVSSKNTILYDIEGSYARRCCTVYDEKRRKVAEVQRKEAVGGVALGYDVFRLIVQPGLDTSIAMALVILLDQMFGSNKT